MSGDDEYEDDYATCSRTQASLRIIHDDLDPEEITRQLGTQPSWSWRKGEPRGKGKRPSHIGIWGLSTEKYVESRDLRRHLDWLISQMSGKEETFAQLRARGYRLDVFCLWQSRGQGGPTISPKNMRGLGALGLELGIDIYWDDNESDT